MITTLPTRHASRVNRRAPRENEFTVDQLILTRVIVDRGQLSGTQRRELNKRTRRGQLARNVTREGWVQWWAV